MSPVIAIISPLRVPTIAISPLTQNRQRGKMAILPIPKTAATIAQRHPAAMAAIILIPIMAITVIPRTIAITQGVPPILLGLIAHPAIALLGNRLLPLPLPGLSRLI
jgi:hypothetical protein